MRIETEPNRENPEPFQPYSFLHRKTPVWQHICLPLFMSGKLRYDLQFVVFLP